MFQNHAPNSRKYSLNKVVTIIFEKLGEVRQEYIFNLEFYLKIFELTVNLKNNFKRVSIITISWIIFKIDYLL